MISSQYTVAGFETLASILNRFMLGKNGSWNDNFTREEVNRFFLNTCNKFLHSFGQHFGKAKKYDKYLEKEIRLYEQCRDTKFFDGCEFIADSGGFQASIGDLGPEQTDSLINLYYTFLRDHHNVIDKAFILDLPPGPGCRLFNNFKQVYDKNLESYNIAKNLPKEAKEKIVYIHHFRTPKLWDIYTKILKEEDMFSHFNYFGTGGIVANMSSDISVPCAIYVLPLIPLINEAKKHNHSKLHFHILGGANYRDILFYEFFKLHVLKKHNLELDITFDSSTLFKGLMIGRFINVLDYKDMVVRKVSLRSHELIKRFDYDRRVIDLYKQILDLMAEKHNFKKLDIDSDKVYNLETGTFYEDAKVYSMLYMLDMYSIMQTNLRNFALESYPYYEEGKFEDFTNLISLQTKSLNNGKLTRKQTSKTNIMIKSLDMLTNLDENLCKYMITKYLSGDEFTNLLKKRILTF